MIIDAHAHLLAPEVFYAYRSRLQATAGCHGPQPPKLKETDVDDAIARNVAVMDAVGTDIQILSPRPFQQGHSMQPPRVVDYWIAANNDLIASTVQSRPDRFAGIAGLPLSPNQPVERVLPELDRCVRELGFVGCSLNPDPSEGAGTVPGLGDPYWFPLYERLVEFDVPALVHSGGCNNERETYSEHFITEASIAVLSLLRSDVFARFPGLKLLISHGGGSVPYQIGRWRAARRHAALGGSDELPSFDSDLRRLWFDTVLYSEESLQLLVRVVGPDRCVFGSEKPGSGSAVDPQTGRDFDDLRPIIEQLDGLTLADRGLIFERNARMLFNRLDCSGAQ